MNIGKYSADIKLVKHDNYKDFNHSLKKFMRELMVLYSGW